MEQILLLGICFVIGIALGAGGLLPDNAPRTLNAFVINISLPAMVLLRVHDLPFSPSLLIPIAVPWAIFAGAAALFPWLGKRVGLDRRTVGALILLAGLGNTSFVGLPMIEAFFGSAKAVGIGVLVDQPGSFLVLATLGLLTAARFSGDRGTRPMAAVVRVLRFPPFIAMLAAIALSPWPYPHAAAAVLTRLADTLAPVALVAVGLQVRLVSLRSNARPMALALCYKMVAAPACIALLLMLTGLEPGVAHVTTFEAAMPPMITGGIVAIEHDLNPTLVALVLGVSIPLAFVTLPIWRWILGPA